MRDRADGAAAGAADGAVDWSRYDAVLLDLDGVVTSTAPLHRQAWAELFADVLAGTGAPPYTEADYFAHVDGRPRYEGVAELLRSRGLGLPWGDPSDGPDRPTVCGLGNRKNRRFNALLVEVGVQAYPGTVALLDLLARRGVRTAVVTSSANARAVLAATGLADRFDVVVDGDVATRERLAGKPRPDTYAHAAAALGVPPARAVVVEDALSGVEAGAAGGFGLVVGVDRGVGADALRAHGADLVVRDLAELVPAGRAGRG